MAGLPIARVRVLDHSGAPPAAFRSLSVHLWDLAWDAGWSTADTMLSQVLLCWTPGEVEWSLSRRTQVYLLGEVPHYLHWLLQHRSPGNLEEVSRLVLGLAQETGRALEDQSLEQRIQPALVTAMSGYWHDKPARINADSLEAQDLMLAFQARGLSLPSPLDWNAPGQVRPALQQLRAHPGLEAIALQFERLIHHASLQARRRELGLVPMNASMHMVFTGNPGTGKTTAARLLGQALLEQGLLTGCQVIEVACASLIGEYVGQTSPRVVQAMDDAAGGVLLIDEAHGLLTDGQDPYGREALDSLVKGMEDRRDSLVVILCGYPREIDALLDANPGLRSRIARTIRFPDYTAGQLLEIFRAIAAEHDYRLGDGAATRAAQLFQERVQTGEAARGNARMVRNIFEEAVQHQAARLADTPVAPAGLELSTLLTGDLGERENPPLLQA